MNRDPVGEEGGVNLLVFVAGSPVNSIDPFGLEQCGAEDEEEHPNWLETIIKFIISNAKHTPTPMSFTFDSPGLGGDIEATDCDLKEELIVVNKGGVPIKVACCFDCVKTVTGPGPLGVTKKTTWRYGWVWIQEPGTSCPANGYHSTVEG